jgi:hypothetical protein
MEQALWVKVLELVEEWVLAVLVLEWDEDAVEGVDKVVGDLSPLKTSCLL